MIELSLQFLKIFKQLFGAQIIHELNRYLFAVKIAAVIKDMRFAKRLLNAPGGAVADIGESLIRPAAEQHAAFIHAEARNDKLFRQVLIERWKADGSAAPIAVDDGRRS